MNQPISRQAFSSDSTTDDELVDRARALRPMLLGAAARCDELGELTPEVISALFAGGFMDMCVPRRLGGLCSSANAMARASAELAKGSPSAAWVVTIMNTAVWRLTLMSDATQEEFFADRIPRFCGVAMPPGKARRVEGGYLIESGRWPYASGSHHAEYFHGPIAIEGVKGPAPLAIIPMSDLVIEHSWKVTGMKATGSDTIVANNLFVPTHRVPAFEGGFTYKSRTSKNELTDMWTPLPLMRSKALGVLVGTAEGLLETVCGGGQDKPMLWTDYARKGNSPVFQALIGRAGAQIHAVRMIMDGLTTMIDQISLEQRFMDLGERAFNRGLMALAVTMLTDAVEMLMNGAGSSAFLEVNDAQRYWRDFSVGSRHLSLIPEVGYEVYGRALLGEPEITRPEYT